jgi:hypothetical protein
MSVYAACQGSHRSIFSDPFPRNRERRFHDKNQVDGVERDVPRPQSYVASRCIVSQQRVFDGD